MSILPIRFTHENRPSEPVKISARTSLREKSLGLEKHLLADFIMDIGIRDQQSSHFDNINEGITVPDEHLGHDVTQAQKSPEFPVK